MGHDYSPSAGEVIGEIYGQAPFIILSTIINIILGYTKFIINIIVFVFLWLIITIRIFFSSA
jgi:hypothetical protein